MGVHSTYLPTGKIVLCQFPLADGPEGWPLGKQGCRPLRRPYGPPPLHWPPGPCRERGVAQGPAHIPVQANRPVLAMDLPCAVRTSAPGSGWHQGRGWPLGPPAVPPHSGAATDRQAHRQSYAESCSPPAVSQSSAREPASGTMRDIGLLYERSDFSPASSCSDVSRSVQPSSG